MSEKSNPGFTTIEILIITIIVAILASVLLVALGSARNRARDNSFRSTAASLQKALILCCSASSNLISPVNPGDRICSGGDFYADTTALESIAVNTNCQPDGSFQITVTPGSNNTGTCTSAVITSVQTTLLNGANPC